MLAFVVQPVWFQGKSKVKLPLSVRDLVEGWSDELQFDAEWVEQEVDHKKIRSTSVDFDTKSQALEKHRNVLAHIPDYYPKGY